MKAPPRFLMRGLLHAYYWCDESLQKSIDRAGWAPLPRTQSMIMVNVSDGVTRPAELARQLGISRQAIQQTLAEMQSAGLISLRRDPVDRRAKIVVFSSRGRGIGRAALRAIEAMERELARRLGAATLRTLRLALERDWGPHVVSTTVARGALRRRAARAAPRRGSAALSRARSAAARRRSG